MDFYINKQTLGVRNCNPLNIRYSPMNKWQGQTGCNRGFCTFDNMELGFRAALVLLRNYVRRGLVTPAQIVSNWAPENENDTKAYIRQVGPWNPYDYRISTIADLCIVAADMARVESCIDVVPLELIHLANKYNITLK